MQGRSKTRLRLAYGCAVLAIIAAGLAVRHPGTGLPWPLAKYAGSALWGTMVYFVVAVVAPRAGPPRRAGAAAVLAALVELVRLVHAPWLDAFRMTTAGGLLLGRIFSPWNIAAYWLGILGGAVADRFAANCLGSDARGASRRRAP